MPKQINFLGPIVSVSTSWVERESKDTCEHNPDCLEPVCSVCGRPAHVEKGVVPASEDTLLDNDLFIVDYSNLFTGSKYLGVDKKVGENFNIYYIPSGHLDRQFIVDEPLALLQVDDNLISNEIGWMELSHSAQIDSLKDSFGEDQVVVIWGNLRWVEHEL